MNTAPQQDTNAMKECFKNEDISLYYNITKKEGSILDGSVFASSHSNEEITDVKINFLIQKFVILTVLDTSGFALQPGQSLGIKNDFTLTSSDLAKKLKFKNKFFLSLNSKLFIIILNIIYFSNKRVHQNHFLNKWYSPKPTKPTITAEVTTIAEIERTEAIVVPIYGANVVALIPQIVPVRAPSKIKPKLKPNIKIIKPFFFDLYILIKIAKILNKWLIAMLY